MLLGSPPDMVHGPSAAQDPTVRTPVSVPLDNIIIQIFGIYNSNSEKIEIFKP